jgi:hypothetical protein
MAMSAAAASSAKSRILMQIRYGGAYDKSEQPIQAKKQYDSDEDDNEGSVTSSSSQSYKKPNTLTCKGALCMGQGYYDPAKGFDKCFKCFAGNRNTCTKCKKFPVADNKFKECAKCNAKSKPQCRDCKKPIMAASHEQSFDRCKPCFIKFKAANESRVCSAKDCNEFTESKMISLCKTHNNAALDEQREATKAKLAMIKAKPAITTKKLQPKINAFDFLPASDDDDEIVEVKELTEEEKKLKKERKAEKKARHEAKKLKKEKKLEKAAAAALETSETEVTDDKILTPPTVVEPDEVSEADDNKDQQLEASDDDEDLRLEAEAAKAEAEAKRLKKELKRRQAKKAALEADKAEKMAKIAKKAAEAAAKAAESSAVESEVDESDISHF